VYVLLDVQKRMQPSLDLRRFVWLLEEWIIRTLASFDVQGERREGRVGIWVAESPVASRHSSVVSAELLTAQGAAAIAVGSGAALAPAFQKEAKIAALGIRIRRGVSYHGLAINLNPDLSHYAGIIPCGIREHGVTSLATLGKNVSMEALDAELQRQFALLDFVASS
jgi:lipoyl(octanoyl) transferase